MFKARDAKETLAVDLKVTVGELRAVTGELSKWNDRMRIRNARSIAAASAESSPARRRRAPDSETP